MIPETPESRRAQLIRQIDRERTELVQDAQVFRQPLAAVDRMHRVAVQITPLRSALLIGAVAVGGLLLARRFLPRQMMMALVVEAWAVWRTVQAARLAQAKTAALTAPSAPTPSQSLGSEWRGPG